MFPRPRLLVIVGALALALLSTGFGTGFLVAEHRTFPYWGIRRAWNALESVLPSSEAVETTTIETNLLRLRAREFPWTLDAPPEQYGGGGLAVLDDVVIGVDKHGVFFHYDGDAIRRLPLSVQTNIEDLLREKRDTDAFRFLDIAAVADGARSQLFVSYHFWHPERQCKTTRVSRLIVEDIETLVSPTASQPADGWEAIFESQPCIEFDERRGSAFQSNLSGGRLLPDGRNGLLFSLGDHHLDGVNNRLVAAQDSSISYGKILRIDLVTLDTRIYASGIRSPGGLLLDRAGNLWETEHGPKGGDELNLMRDQGNYGWPLTTFGTQYFKYAWDLNALQGHHQGAERGFEAPVYSWIPSVGVSNLIQIDGQIQHWKDDIVVSSLTGRSLFRLRVQDGRVLFAERIPVGGRVRDLVQMRDGTILLWTDDRALIELSPIAEADQDRATDVIGTCGTCHSFRPNTANPAGPSLWGVYGRSIASTDYEDYSDAFRAATGVWDEDTLRAFLLDPQSVVSGTTMPTPPIPDDDTMATLIAVLRALK